MRAKLTDFGTTRERFQNNTVTMSYGMGRWTAPDYSPAADIFSIGVVLAELDSHALPYEGLCNTNGNILAHAEILQLVSTGELRLRFGAACSEKIAQIADRCLALNPDHRPKVFEVCALLADKASDRVVTPGMNKSR